MLYTVPLRMVIVQRLFAPSVNRPSPETSLATGVVGSSGVVFKATGVRKVVFIALATVVATSALEALLNGSSTFGVTSLTYAPAIRAVATGFCAQPGTLLPSAK